MHNLWLDVQRRRKWQGPPGEADEPNAADADPAATADALTKAAALNSAQEFASTLLEDVYEFTLKEIADFTGGGQRHRRAGTPGNALRGGSSARALAG